MQEKQIKVSRKDLYEKVWSTPLRKLAPEYGLSDVGLGKLCKRHNIPRPGVGYWAKQDAGKKVKKKPLPLADNDEIVFSWWEDDPLLVDEQQLAAAEQIVAAVKNDTEAIYIFDSVRSCCPIVKEASKSLRLPLGEYGRRTDTRFANIDVSRNMLRRALCVFDAIVRKAQKCGISILPPKNDTDSVAFSVLGEKVDFGIREQRDRFLKELTAAQKR